MTEGSSFRPFLLGVKRLLDIAGAGVLLVAFMPLLLTAAAGTWFSVGWPIFFRQVRPGLKGQPFAPIKFRTMRSGRGSDDVRTTKLGRLFRKCSIDELPQLWNVLIGEMSLVGPRPLLMDFLDRYPPRLGKRHDVRPGVTGWCQVKGRNSISWDKKFDLDVWYVENWSLALDLKILFLTLGKVFRNHDVDGPGNMWPECLGYPLEGPPDLEERERLVGEGCLAHASQRVKEPCLECGEVT